MGMTNEVVLSFGCPYRTDLLYNELFDELAENHKNFHYLKSISREDPRPDGSKPYVQYSIIDQKALMLPILEKKNTLIYACGLEGMETGIFQILAMLGLYEYLDLKEEVKDVDPLKWSQNQLKRKVKPSERLFLEVY
jgi:ferredoxin--NADP+ reductase